MTDNTATKCEYILLENGIHQFILLEGSLAGADAFLSQLEQIYQTRDENSAPLLVLSDSSNASLPISYSMQRSKELRDKYPNIGSIYTATLTSRIVEARLADSMMRLMRFKNTRMRFFDSARRDQAIEWLLQQE